MSIAEWIVAIVGPAGLVALVPRAMKEYREIKNGNARREKEANRNAIGRVAEFQEESEFQTEWRRIISEHASCVRRIAIEWGVPEDRLPPWPKPPAREKV